MTTSTHIENTLSGSSLSVIGIFINIVSILGLFLFGSLVTACNVLSKTSNYIYLKIFIIWDNVMDSAGRRRVIMDRSNKEPYLIRYYLLFKDRGDQKFNIFIHKIVKGDDDENMHDHPWGFFTLILSGGYNEKILNKDKQETTHRRRPGYYHYVSAKHTHTITLDENSTPCWTLFFPFKKEKKWGFYVKDKWVESEEYFQMKNTIC